MASEPVLKIISSGIKATGFIFSLLLLTGLHSESYGQDPTVVLDSTGETRKTVIAGNYSHTPFHQFLFGKHYRKEWATPVTVKVIMLDTLAGGLTPYEAGGGRQSKSLKLRDKKQQEYVLRSLDKSFGRALPEVFQGTFVEDLVDDQVTIANPYAAVTIPPLAEAAGILHTNPVIGYVPKQPALDSFNEDFGDRLYMFEQRPDENWETADNFDNSTNIISTRNLLDKLQKDNRIIIDQPLYVRSRLFDMLIGDWSRHEDQWRWAYFEEGNRKLYKPVPRDRDQAYTLFDGLLPKLVLHAADLDYLQSFGPEIDEVKVYNNTARHLDRRMANETTLEQWTSIAKDLQKRITDETIIAAIRTLPPEIYPVSGPRIIDDLKSRRDQLAEYAEKYYLFLARHVDIPGTEKRELFEVTRIDDESTSVKVFRIKESGAPDTIPIYSRVFKTTETKDINLYGIGGADIFTIKGQTDKGIKIRIIGGEDRDSIIDESSVKGLAKKTRVFDDRKNDLRLSSETAFHRSRDSADYAYNYETFQYHKKGLRLSIFYDNPDRIYTSLGYRFRRAIWRKSPYGFDQAFYIRYSISQNALSLLYEGEFNQWIGKWNARLSANYDAIRWTNFFGLGNETNWDNHNKEYFRLRTNEFIGEAGLNRVLKKHHLVELTAFFQGVEVIDDAGKFVTEHFTDKQLYYYEHHKYIGARLGYTYQNVNDRIVPTKGIMFYAGVAYSNNIEQWEKSFSSYNSILQLYVPLVRKFSLSLRSGVSTVRGEPEFYQYASIGGSQNLRGFVRDRYWGRTAFYNTNELRWITDFSTYIMKGKAGLVGFVDHGRVWMENESSDKWHLGYGGGVLLSPFNKFSVSLVYGISEDDQLFQLKFNKVLY